MLNFLFYLSDITALPSSFYIMLLITSSIYPTIKLLEDNPLWFLFLSKNEDKKTEDQSEDKGSYDKDKEQDYEEKYKEYVKGIDKEMEFTKKNYDQLYYTIMTKLKVRNRVRKKNVLSNLIYRLYKRFSWNRIRLFIKSFKKPFKYHGINYNFNTDLSQMGKDSFLIRLVRYIHKEFYTSKYFISFVPTSEKKEKKGFYKDGVHIKNTKEIEKFLDNVRTIQMKRNKKIYYILRMFRWFIPAHSWRMLFHDPSTFGRREGLNEVYLLPTIWENSVGEIIRPLSHWIQRWASYTFNYFPMRVEFTTLRQIYEQPWLQMVFLTLLKNRRRVYVQRKSRHRTKHLGNKKKIKKSSKFRKKIRFRPKFNRMTVSILLNYFFIYFRILNSRRLFLSQLINFSKYPIYKASIRYMSSDFFSLMKRYKRKSRSVGKKRGRRRKKYKHLKKRKYLFGKILKRKQKKKLKKKLKRNLLEQARKWLLQNRIITMHFNTAIKQLSKKNISLIDNWLKKNMPLAYIKNYYNYNTWLSRIKLDLTMALLAVVSPSYFKKLLKKDIELMKRYKYRFLLFLKYDHKGIQRTGQSFSFFLGPKLLKKTSSFFLNIKERTKNSLRQLFVNSLFKAYSLYIINKFSKGYNKSTDLLKKPNSRIVQHFRTLYGFIFKTDKYKSYHGHTRQLKKKMKHKLFRAPNLYADLYKKKVKKSKKRKFFYSVIKNKYLRYRPYTRYLKLKLMNILDSKITSPKKWMEFLYYLKSQIDHTSLTNFKQAMTPAYIHLSYHLKRFYANKDYTPMKKSKGLRMFLFGMKSVRKMNRHVKRYSRIRLRSISRDKYNHARYSRFSSLMNKTRYSLLNNQYILIKEIYNKYVKTPTVNYHKRLLSFLNPLLIKYHGLYNTFLFLNNLKRPSNIGHKYYISDFIKSNNVIKSIGDLFLQALIRSINLEPYFKQAFEYLFSFIKELTNPLVRSTCLYITIFLASWFYTLIYSLIPIINYICLLVLNNFVNLYVTVYYRHKGEFDAIFHLLMHILTYIYVSTIIPVFRIVYNLTIYLLDYINVSIIVPILRNIYNLVIYSLNYIYAIIVRPFVNLLYMLNSLLMFVIYFLFSFSDTLIIAKHIVINTFIKKIKVFIMNTRFAMFLLRNSRFYVRRPSWNDHRMLALVYTYARKIPSKGWRYLLYYIGFSYRYYYRPTLYGDYRLSDFMFLRFRNIFDIMDEDWEFIYPIFRGHIILKAFIRKVIQCVFSYFFGTAVYRRYILVFAAALDNAFNFSFYLRLLRYILLGPIVTIIIDPLLTLVFYSFKLAVFLLEKLFFRQVRLELGTGDWRRTPMLDFIYTFLHPTVITYRFIGLNILLPIRQFGWNFFMECGIFFGRCLYTFITILTGIYRVFPFIANIAILVYSFFHTLLYYLFIYSHQSVLWFYTIINLFIPIANIIAQNFAATVPRRFIGGLDYVVNLEEEISNLLVIVTLLSFSVVYFYIACVRSVDFSLNMFKLRKLRKKVMSLGAGNYGIDALLDPIIFKDGFEAYYLIYLHKYIQKLNNIYFDTIRTLRKYAYRNALTNLNNYLLFFGVSGHLKKHSNFMYKTKDHEYMSLMTGWKHPYPYIISRGIKKSHRKGKGLSTHDIAELSRMETKFILRYPTRYEYYNPKDMEKIRKKFRLHINDRIRKHYLGDSKKRSITLDSYYYWLKGSISKIKQKYLGSRSSYQRFIYFYVYIKNLFVRMIFSITHTMFFPIFFIMVVYFTLLRVCFIILLFLYHLFVPFFLKKYLNAFFYKVHNKIMNSISARGVDATLDELLIRNKRIVFYLIKMFWSPIVSMLTHILKLAHASFFIALRCFYKAKRDYNYDMWIVELEGDSKLIGYFIFLFIKFPINFMFQFITSSWKYMKGNKKQRQELLYYEKYIPFRPTSNDYALFNYLLPHIRKEEEDLKGARLRYKHIRPQDLF